MLRDKHGRRVMADVLENWIRWWVKESKQMSREKIRLVTNSVTEGDLGKKGRRLEPFHERVVDVALTAACRRQFLHDLSNAWLVTGVH